MNIKNQEYADQKQKRDRMMNYWQHQVCQNYLPPIDSKKKLELDSRKDNLGDTGLRRQYTSTSKQRRHLKQTSSYQRIHLEGLDQYSETTNLKLATPMNRGMKSNM